MKKILLFSYLLIEMSYYSFSQNVGIGTTTPAFKLDVQGGSINTDSVYRIGTFQVISIKGINNFFAGKNAGLNTTGLNFNNTAVGANSLMTNTAGLYNSALGTSALFSNISGSSNTAIGNNALYSNTTGNDNTASGGLSLNKNTTGSNNTANGLQALRDNTIGKDNTGIGNAALLTNDDGSYNVALGSLSMSSSIRAFYNTAAGYKSLNKITNGSSNVAIGYSSLSSNDTGSTNTCIGANAGFKNLVSANTFLGAYAGYSNTVGNSNVSAGYQSGFGNTTGVQNTFIGNWAGKINQSGGGNTCIGYNSSCGIAYYNAIALGAYSVVTASDQVRVGNSSTSSIGGYVGWTSISDERAKKNINQNVPGLVFINLLKPATYNYDLTAADNIISPQGNPNQRNAAASPEIQSQNNKDRLSKEKIVYTGFLAQDVEKAAKKIGYDFSGVDAPKNNSDLYGLRYDEFVVPLVKAVQELSAQNDLLQAQIDLLKKEIDLLKLKN